jgi:hypothetical protein
MPGAAAGLSNLDPNGNVLRDRLEHLDVVPGVRDQVTLELPDKDPLVLGLVARAHVSVLFMTPQISDP